MARAAEEYVIIVAGGTGTRLWPLSRKARPKKFLNILGDRSFMQTVYRRALKIAPQKRVFIVAPEDYSAYLKQYLPEFPQENFMGEPVKKGTTAAYGYTATYIKQLNPDAVLHIIAADDYLEDENKYAKALKEAAKIALAKDALVIYGVKPATSRVLEQIESDLKPPSRLEAEKLKRHYLQFVESSIDNQVLEKMIETTHMVVLEENWSDVGTWDHVWALKKKDGSGNVVIGDRENIYSVGALNNLVIPGQKPLALVGVTNLVIIDAGDILLVCDKTKAQDVKKLVNLLKEKKLKQYL